MDRWRNRTTKSKMDCERQVTVLTKSGDEGHVENAAHVSEQLGLKEESKCNKGKQSGQIEKKVRKMEVRNRLICRTGGGQGQTGAGEVYTDTLISRVM